MGGPDDRQEGESPDEFESEHDVGDRVVQLHPRGVRGTPGGGANPRTAEADGSELVEAEPDEGSSPDDQRGAPDRRSRNLTYVETSALLSWLLNEPRREEVLYWLDGADVIVTSALTFLEARRSLMRLLSAGLNAEAVLRIEGRLRDLEDSWWIVPIYENILANASQPFKIEPVRSLDAIHLASARMVAASHAESIIFLALDKRVRVNAIADYHNVAPLPTEEEWQAADASGTTEE